jgi:hypothetical protein
MPKQKCRKEKEFFLFLLLPKTFTIASNWDPAASMTDGVVFALVKQIFQGTGKLESGARQSGRTSIGQGRGSIRYYVGVTFAPAQSSSQAVTKKKSHADYNERADATHHKAIAEGGKAEQRGMRSERRKEKISIPYR